MGLKNDVHRQILMQLRPEDIEELNGLANAQKFAHIEKIVNDILRQWQKALPATERAKLIESIVFKIVGLGPIEQYLNDPRVTEVMVNKYDTIFIEREGKIEQVEAKFDDDEDLLRVIERIVSPLGRRIDESSPLVDARLPDGSRVNAIIPPLALFGPSLTIRKFRERPFTPQDLIQSRTFTFQMALFLKACVEARLNILIAGGTGSGKTTTLNLTSSFIPGDQRIVTIEDSAELQLHQPNLVALETKSANIEGKGAYTIRDLVKNSLRMRPDRIIVGEVRGGEALDMLQAMNTGHDGSLTTAHANSPRDALFRIETMVLMAGLELPLRAVREQVASALDLVVFQERLLDGQRKITAICEVLGVEDENIELRHIFAFTQETIDSEGRVIGHFGPAGYKPKCLEKLASYGLEAPETLFDVAAWAAVDCFDTALWAQGAEGS